MKVQYPGAGDALLGDLRQLARVARGLAPVFPGIDVVPLVEELQARAADELDYQLEAEAQTAFADAFRDDPDIVVPRVVDVGETVLVTRVAREPRVARVAHHGRHPGGARPLRRAAGALPVRRTGAHRDAPRRPAPRQLPGAARPRTAGRDGSACSTSVPSPGCPSAGSRRRWAPCCGSPPTTTRRRWPRACGARASSRTGSRSTRSCVLDYLAPFAEPTRVRRVPVLPRVDARAVRAAQQPPRAGFTVATKLNLPPSYLLIHRTWLGGIGVLSQLEAEAPFRAILEESLPGFAG